MKAFSVPEVKPFMAGLLQGKLFHGWELRSAELGLMSRIEIQGSINSDYWTEEEKKRRTCPYLLWDEIQPKIRSLIQGGHTPSYMNITLAVPPSRVPDIVQDFVESFLINIRFETGSRPDEAMPAASAPAPVSGQKPGSGTLIIVTGLSTKSFTMDKTPERLWDEKVPAYFKAHQILLV